jgi:hypothetical protein
MTRAHQAPLTPIKQEPSNDPRPRGPERDPVAEVRALLRRPRRRARDRAPDPPDAGSPAARHGGLLREDVRHHRGLPPLFLAPLLPHVARVPAVPRRPRHHRDAEGTALVGRPPPRPPPLLRRSRGHPFTRHQRVLVESRRVDPVEAARRHEARPREGPRPVPRAPVARPLPRRAGGGLRAGAVGARRRARGALGLLCFDGAPLARHVPRELAHPRLRAPPLRHGRRLAEQLSHRARHDGRGVAQQPPSLSVDGEPGLVLVGDRRDLLRAPGARGRRPRCATGLAAGPPRWARRPRRRRWPPPPRREARRTRRGRRRRARLPAPPGDPP